MNHSVFHITCLMHNSRTSLRMLDNKIKNGIAEFLTISEEEKLVEIICSHILKYQLIILNFNICGDHIHFIIKCNPTELSYLVGRLKSISAREFNIWRGLTIPINKQPNFESAQKNEEKHFLKSIEHESLSLKNRGETQNSLWAQKFNRVQINTLEQLNTTMLYIENNRIKHELPQLSQETITLIYNSISNISILF